MTASSPFMARPFQVHGPVADVHGAAHVLENKFAVAHAAEVGVQREVDVFRNDEEFQIGGRGVRLDVQGVSAGNETARISWLQFRFRDESESSARRGLRRRMAP